MHDDKSDSSDEITSDAAILSFIVRVWKEEPSSEPDQEIWRGHITPIPNGARHYFTDMDQIPDFIRNHLKSTR